MSDQPLSDRPGGLSAAREEQVARGLTETRSRIEDACRQAGRAAHEVTLVVVTKFFPVSDVRVLHGLGVRDVGENRHQEAEAKVAECADLGLTWHFVGSLQSNKAAAVAAYADVVHSVDRAKLVPGLSRGAEARGRPLDVLLQLDLDPDPQPGRGGVRPSELTALVENVLAAESLRLRGVMTVAPLGMDPARAFAELADAASVVRRSEASATWMSAGMSADLEDAIAAGATHVRVGSAVLGTRLARR